jgi:hypothetical protein
MPVLVVPRFSARGTVCLPLLLGSLVGIAGGLTRPGFATGTTAEIVLVIGHLVGPDLVMATAAALLLPRRWAVFLTVLTFSSFHVFFNEFTRSLIDPTNRGAAMLVGRSPQGFLQLVFSFLVFGLALATLALGLRWLARRIVLTLVEQDGGLCWRCGYRAGSDSIRACPECGIAAGQGQRFKHAFHMAGFAKRSARIALAAAALLVTMLALVWAGDAEVRRLAGFYWRFPERIGGHVPGSVPVATAWITLDAGRGLRVDYAPGDHAMTPPMELRLAVKGTGAIGAYIQHVQPGALCQLNRAQAQHVIAQGIPASLIQAFRQSEQSTSQGGLIPADPHFAP